MTAADVATHLAHFIHPDQVTELRALHVGGRGRTFSGWFTGRNLDDMARHALALSRQAAGVYFTPNPVDPALLARRPNRVLDVHKGFALTHDSDILERRYLIVDADPRRVGANQDQPTTARELAFVSWATKRYVRPFVKSEGFGEPIVMCSGNGIHLVYRLSHAMVGGTDATRSLIASFLAVLSDRFSCFGYQIDPNTFNACRMLKVPGTTVRKGDSTPLRPYRSAKLLEVPDGWLAPAEPPGTRQLPQQVPARIPEPAKPVVTAKRKPVEPTRLFDAPARFDG